MGDLRWCEAGCWFSIAAGVTQNRESIGIYQTCRPNFARLGSDFCPNASTTAE
ncbi:MAG: hypothetical protein HC894_09355 [Microcoleus sp. SM1_3_4]|nr:hypothetical protein [Microcoleus sp. SM1_3_4]